MAVLKYKFAKIAIGIFWEELEKTPDMPCATKDEVITACWLLTGPEINSAGLFKIKAEKACPPSLTPKEYEAAITGLCNRFSWRYNPRTWIFIITSWFKYSNVCNSKHLWGVLADIAGIKDSEMLLLWAEHAKKHIIRVTAKTDKNPTGTNLHEIIDNQVGILLSGQTNNTPPSLAAPTESKKPEPKIASPKKPAKEPMVFSDTVNQIYEKGVAIFKGNGHKPKTTPGYIEKEKNQIRLMLETDKETHENIMKGLEFLKLLPDRNDKWAGRGKHCGAFKNFREKWGEHIRVKVVNTTSQPNYRPDFMPKEGSLE